MIKFIKSFLTVPLFHDATTIEKSLNIIWDRQLYNDLKTVYYEMKKAVNNSLQPKPTGSAEFGR